jgi:tetratricopeptide (TPR) repeat protein
MVGKWGDTVTKHYTLQEIESYRRRSMPAVEILVVNEHLATCDECYGKFRSRSLLTSTYDFARTDLESAENEELEHLSFDQILAYVDNELDEIERGIASIHLEICSECDDICRDLRRFKSDLALGKVYAAEPRPTRFWARFGDRLAMAWQSYRIPFKAVAAGAAATAVIWFFIGSYQKVFDLQTQVEELRRQNNSLKNDLSAVSSLRTQLDQLSREKSELQERANALRAASVSPNSLVALNDAGGRVALHNRGELEGVGFISSEHRTAVIDALRAGRVKASGQLSSLLGEQKRLMGSRGGQRSFIPLSPVGAVVATNQPTFRWKRVSGATAYTVTIYRNNLKEIVSSQTLTGTQWNSPPLARDRTYSWQIRAIKDDREMIWPPPDAREARFRVLSQSEVDDLERIKATYAKSHLTLGVIYAQMGLFDEAATEFRALLAANPGSPIVKQLLRSVTSGRLN